MAVAIITPADVGRTLATNGMLRTVRCLTATTARPPAFFTLVDDAAIGAHAIISLDLASTGWVSSPRSMGNCELLTDGDIGFDALKVAAVPSGATFELEWL
jgi:hypothetical protein